MYNKLQENDTLDTGTFIMFMFAVVLILFVFSEVRPTWASNMEFRLEKKILEVKEILKRKQQ